MSEHSACNGKMSNGASVASSEAMSEMKSILVIDDEPMIGRLITAMLRGYLVEAFVDPHAALARAREVAFAAVLSDLLMPNVNGAELYVALGEQAPDLRSRFVLMTGCDSDPWVSRFLAESNVPVLRKPFRAAELRARVDAVLGGGHVPNRLSDQGFSR